MIILLHFTVINFFLFRFSIQWRNQRVFNTVQILFGLRIYSEIDNYLNTFICVPVYTYSLPLIRHSDPERVTRRERIRWDGKINVVTYVRSNLFHFTFIKERSLICIRTMYKYFPLLLPSYLPLYLVSFLPSLLSFIHRYVISDLLLILN